MGCSKQFPHTAHPAKRNPKYLPLFFGLSQEPQSRLQRRLQQPNSAQSGIDVMLRAGQLRYALTHHTKS